MDLEHTPVLAPPPGVIPNFISPESQADVFTITSNIFLAMVLSVFLMRIYTNFWIKRKVRADDGSYECIMSYTLRLTSSIVACILSTVTPLVLIRFLSNGMNRQVLYVIHRR